jgi:hypothetical protein
MYIHTDTLIRIYICIYIYTWICYIPLDFWPNFGTLTVTFRLVEACTLAPEDENWPIFICIHKWTSVHISMYIYTYIYIYIHTYLHIYITLGRCLHFSTRRGKGTYKCIHTYMDVYGNMCLNLYIYVYIYIYIEMYCTYLYITLSRGLHFSTQRWKLT